MNQRGLQHLSTKWRQSAERRTLLLSASAGILVAAMGVRFSLGASIATGLVTAAAVGLTLRKRTRPVTPVAVAAHLNRLCPTLEESASLWLKDERSLSLIEQLQLRRIDSAWALLPEKETIGFPPPQNLRGAILSLLFAVLALTAARFWPQARPAVQDLAETPMQLPVFTLNPSRQGKPSLVQSTLTLTPPRYLELPPRTVEGLDAEVPEGSIVAWDITTQGDVTTLTLEGIGTKNPLVLHPQGAGKFRTQLTLVENRLYQISVTSADGSVVRWPDLHTLKVIRDQPPQLTWQLPAVPRTTVEPSNHPLVTVQLSATDDHALGELRLVMTVAKGSGEGVKFREREELLPPTQLAPRERNYSRTLDLSELGLEPGDELYVYATVTDTKTPAANRTRSETRFIVLRGPETTVADPGTTIAGVNRVPQYFRSQRQLIIDTEKLLAEKATLTEEKFRARSEDIGVDQKLLRLRYGQFLGEEFDPESSGAAPEARSLEQANQLRSGRRAEVERSNSVERVVEQQHDHSATPVNRDRPATLEEIRAPFVHNHDSGEAATLFESKVKASLRDVLSAMWEAEGLLRTIQPERALPAENRALELLKELQQADRVYVKRVGFEPAPLKMTERRLHGELDAIPAQGRVNFPEPISNPQINASRATLTALSMNTLAELSAEVGSSTERGLIEASLKEPEKYLGALEIWRRRSGPLSESDRDALQRALWSILPAPTEFPQTSTDSAPELAKTYFEALGASAAANP